MITFQLFPLQDPSPHILIEDGEPVLFIEKMVVAKAEDLLEAVVAWFASFYIFNIKFPKNSKYTLTFLQKGILKLKDKVKIPVKVFKLMKQLENM